MRLFFVNLPELDLLYNERSIRNSFFLKQLNVKFTNMAAINGMLLITQNHYGRHCPQSCPKRLRELTLSEKSFLTVPTNLNISKI